MRLHQAILTPNRIALSMESAFEMLAGQFPKAVIQSATADRSKEFAYHVALKAIHGVKVYFADTYSSW